MNEKGDEKSRVPPVMRAALRGAAQPSLKAGAQRGHQVER
jgi:hypothetical protein